MCRRELKSHRQKGNDTHTHFAQTQAHTYRQTYTHISVHNTHIQTKVHVMNSGNGSHTVETGGKRMRRAECHRHCMRRTQHSALLTYTENRTILHFTATGRRNTLQKHLKRGRNTTNRGNKTGRTQAETASAGCCPPPRCLPGRRTAPGTCISARSFHPCVFQPRTPPCACHSTRSPHSPAQPPHASHKPHRVGAVDVHRVVAGFRRNHFLHCRVVCDLRRGAQRRHWRRFGGAGPAAHFRLNTFNTFITLIFSAINLPEVFQD